MMDEKNPTFFLLVMMLLCTWPNQCTKNILQHLFGAIHLVRTYLQGSSINLKPYSAMSFILSTKATFVKKNSGLVARIVSFDTVGLHLLTFHILEP